MLKEDILLELEQHRSGYISGQVLAGKYGVSRNAVWKAVNALKKEGYKIESVTNRGYILRDDADILSQAGIMSRLKDARVHIIVHDKLDSTNNEAKRLLAADCELDNTIIACNEQLNGRGRNGSSFDSPAGSGVYMTVVFRLEQPAGSPEYVNKITAGAVAGAVSNLCGIAVSVNRSGGIYYNDNKIGGILIEAVTGLESGYIGHIITGVGIAADVLNVSRNDLIAAITDCIMSVYEGGEDSGSQSQLK